MIFQAIPLTITNQTISNAQDLLSALRNYSINQTPHNNTIPLPVEKISQLSSMTLEQIEEGSIILHNNGFVKRGMQQTGPNSFYKTCELTELGRDLPVAQIMAVLQPKPQSSN